MSDDSIHWTVVLEQHAAFKQFVACAETMLERRRRLLETLQPGEPAEKFQRVAGNIEGIKEVLRLIDSQKPKPGDKK